MARPWPHPGHEHPLVRFRKLAAVDSCAWLEGGVSLENLDAHRVALGLSSVWVAELPRAIVPDGKPRSVDAFLDMVSGVPWTEPFILVTQPAGSRALARWKDRGATGVRLAPGLGHDIPMGAWAETAAAAAGQRLVVQIVARTSDRRVRRWSERDLTVGEVAALCGAAPQSAVVSGLSLPEILDLWGQPSANQALFDNWFINSPTAALQRACGAGLQDSLCFATQFPLQSATATALQLAVAALSEEARARIAGGNALRIASKLNTH